MALRFLTPVIKNAERSNWKHELLQTRGFTFGTSPVQKPPQKQHTSDGASQRMHSVVSCLGLSNLMSSFKKRIKLDGAFREVHNHRAAVTRKKSDESVYSTSKGFDVGAFKKRIAPHLDESVSPYRRLYPSKLRSKENYGEARVEKRRPIVTVAKIQENQRVKRMRWPALYKFKGKNESTQKSKNVDNYSRINLKPLYSSKQRYDPGAMTFLKKAKMSGDQSRNLTFNSEANAVEDYRVRKIDRSRVNKKKPGKRSLRDDVLSLRSSIQSDIEMLRWKINRMYSRKQIASESDVYTRLRTNLKEPKKEDAQLKSLEELAESVKIILRDVNQLKIAPSQEKEKPKVEKKESEVETDTKEVTDRLKSFKETLRSKIEKKRLSQTEDLRCRRRAGKESRGKEPKTNELETRPKTAATKEVITFPREKRALLEKHKSAESSTRNFSSFSRGGQEEKGILQTVKSLLFSPIEHSQPSEEIKSTKDALSPKVHSTEAQQVVEDKIGGKEACEDGFVSLKEKESFSKDVMVEKIKRLRTVFREVTCSCDLCERKKAYQGNKLPTTINNEDSKESVSIRSSTPITSDVIRSIEDFKVPLKSRISEYRRHRGLIQASFDPPRGGNKSMDRKFLCPRIMEASKKQYHSDSSWMTKHKIRIHSEDAYRPLYPSKEALEMVKAKLDPPVYQRKVTRLGLKEVAQSDVERLKMLIITKTRSDPSFQPSTKFAEQITRVEEDKSVMDAKVTKVSLKPKEIQGENCQTKQDMLPKKDTALHDLNSHYAGAKLLDSEDLDEENPTSIDLPAQASVSNSTSKEASYRNFVTRVEYLSWLISKDKVDKNPIQDTWKRRLLEDKISRNEQFNSNAKIPPTQRPERERPKTENGGSSSRNHAHHDISYWRTRTRKSERPSYLRFPDSISSPEVNAEKLLNLRLPKKIPSRQREKTWFTEDEDS